MTEYILSDDTILKLMLTPTQYCYIHDYQLGIKPAEIARKYNVTPAAVSNTLTAAKRRIMKSGIENLKRILTNEEIAYMKNDVIHYIDDNGEVKLL